jgi:hypothetical protein
MSDYFFLCLADGNKNGRAISFAFLSGFYQKGDPGKCSSRQFGRITCGDEAIPLPIFLQQAGRMKLQASSGRDGGVRAQVRPRRTIVDNPIANKSQTIAPRAMPMALINV